MGCKGTCLDYKPHWVSNSVNSVGFCEKPARVGTDTLQYCTEISIFGHICTPISRKPEFSRHSRLYGLMAMGCKGTCIDYKAHWVSNSLNSVGFCEKPARVGTDTLQYCAEISIFGHLCTPISRKLEFSRHSRLYGLKVHPFYCKSH